MLEKDYLGHKKSRCKSQLSHLGTSCMTLNYHCLTLTLFSHLRIINVKGHSEISPWLPLALSAPNTISSEMAPVLFGELHFSVL